MDTQDALHFLPKYIHKQYSQDELNEFVKWTETSSLHAINLIAAEYDELKKIHPELDFPDREWIKILKRRDRLFKAENQAPSFLFIFTNFFKLSRVVVGGFMLILLGISVYFLILSKTRPPIIDTFGRPEDLSNVLVTPKGKQQEMVLPDGSKVMLNAYSTLKVAGEGSRSFELSGEAFFEVAKNPGKPFTVKVRDALIQVLGTRFNVKSYDNDTTTRISLVDGSIKVAKGEESLNLLPGQQAIVDYPASGASANMQLVKEANVQSNLAWKEGYFEFNHEELHAVLAELSRQYDILVIYPPYDDVKGKYFTGRFSRKDSIEHILGLLETAEKIKCDFKHNIVTVNM